MSSMLVVKLEKSLIALILKKFGIVDVKALRPISLVGEVYTIIVKFLATRLKRIVERFISKPHNAFVRGSQSGKS
jgi:hypothetical protein